MKHKELSKRVDSPIKVIIQWIQILLACFIIIAAIINIKNILFLTYEFLNTANTGSYELFTSFLEHVLLLVIGLELTETLIKHTPGSIIEVMLYAIARKMLIHSANTYELLAGSAAIAVLFAVKKYFMSENSYNS